MLTIVLGVTEYGLTGREAVDLPRHASSMAARHGLNRTGGGPAETVLAALRAMGHTVRLEERQGDAESIWIAADGTAYGVNDKRSADSKAAAANLTPPAAQR